MKYFKETNDEKTIKLSDYLKEVEKELEELKKITDSYLLISKRQETELKYRRIKHILESIEDVEILPSTIDAICDTFDRSKCRYGSICEKKETVKAIYEISILFPELTKEALLEISREYIRDLFEEYSLIEILSMMLRKEGISDETFKKFMDLVKDYGDKEEKIYDDIAWHIRIGLGYYSYDFIKHFEKFIKQHHISLEHFYDSLPEVDFILRDQLELKEVSKKAKDCWGMCDPITFQMLEDYLDGDTKLTRFEEQPYYYISTTKTKIPTSYTKQDFITSIQSKHKKLEKK